MSIGEAATYLGMCTKSVTRLCIARKVKHLRVGNQGRLRTGKYRFRRAWLDEYLEEAVVPTQPSLKRTKTKKTAPLVTTVFIDPNDCGNPFEVT